MLRLEDPYRGAATDCWEMAGKESAMQPDKFTALVRNAVVAAQNDALAANHQKITAMHLLRALLSDDNVTVRSLIGRAGGNLGGFADGARQSDCRRSGGDR